MRTLLVLLFTALAFAACEKDGNDLATADHAYTLEQLLEAEAIADEFFATDAGAEVLAATAELDDPDAFAAALDDALAKADPRYLAAFDLLGASLNDESDFWTVERETVALGGANNELVSRREGPRKWLGRCGSSGGGAGTPVFVQNCAAAWTIIRTEPPTSKYRQCRRSNATRYINAFCR